LECLDGAPDRNQLVVCACGEDEFPGQSSREKYCKVDRESARVSMYFGFGELVNSQISGKSFESPKGCGRLEDEEGEEDVSAFAPAALLLEDVECKWFITFTSHQRKGRRRSGALGVVGSRTECRDIL